MIKNFPKDFSLRTYNMITDDNQQWQVISDNNNHTLQSITNPDLNLQLRKDPNPTFFLQNYTNINIHGFTIDNTTYTIVDIIPNDNWKPTLEQPTPIEGVVKKYSKLKLYTILNELNLWDQIEQVMIEKNCTKYWDYAVNLSTDHPLFTTMMEYFTQQFPDLDIQAILDQAEFDE